MKKVIIIGAGIGGLATAVLLASKGYTVEVYERHEMPGGRAGKLDINEFTFDTGPSWYLMPEVFENFYASLGENIHHHLELERLDPAYQVIFENDPKPVEIRADIDSDRKTFEEIEPGSGTQLENYLKKSEKVYGLALKHFLYTNFDSPKELLKLEIFKHAPTMLRQALEPIDTYVSRYFKDLRLKKIMEYPMVFLGTSPYEAPSLYNLMSYMDFKQGVYYPQGGIYTIIESLEGLAKKHGVALHYGADVKSINTQSRNVTGVTLADESTAHADIVISNADLHFTETQLLSPENRSYDESYWEKRQPSPSAILLYLGVRGELPQLRHHNLLFTSDWRYNFETIFKENKWPNPASIYICNPNKTDPSVAPAGHENLFVLIPGPASLADDQAAIDKLADGYLDQIAQMIECPDLKDRIIVKEVVGPKDFYEKFGAWRGSALGMSHVLSQSAFFRPQNKSKRVNNLYYVGGNIAPGIGLPMCLIGAELVTRRIEKVTSS